MKFLIILAAVSAVLFAGAALIFFDRFSGGIHLMEILVHSQTEGASNG